MGRRQAAGGEGRGGRCGMGGELKSLGEQGCLTSLGGRELSRVLTTALSYSRAEEKHMVGGSLTFFRIK